MARGRGFRRAVLGALLVCLGCQAKPEAPPAATITPPPPTIFPGPSGLPAPAAPGGTLTVHDGEHIASWVRNFNPFQVAARWPARGGIYESLLVYNTVKGDYVPWLATGHRWHPDGLKLTFALRPGVQWSDGRPFRAEDVAFTFSLLRRFPDLDPGGIWRSLTGVEVAGPLAVAFSFKKAYTPSLHYIGTTVIVPEHIWKDVAQPIAFANPDPVGTGPFTQVLRFEPKVYELGRNPRYWMAGRPYVETLRMPAYADDKQVYRALLAGELDWTGSFIPDVETAFVGRDPTFHHHWSPPVGDSVMLYLNTTLKPFNDPAVRKAISRGIDRGEIVQAALKGQAPPADATGLNPSYERWKDAAALAQDDDWVNTDPARANALLDAAGLRRGADGIRRVPGGASMRYRLDVVKGWDDWIAAATVIARNLAALGIVVTLRHLDFDAWSEAGSVGRFQMILGFAEEGPTPFMFYRSQMGSSGLRPIGEGSQENWHRYANSEADAILAEFESTASAAKQRELSTRLQRLFVENAPSLPLFPGPSWGQCNSMRFIGFPTEKDPYAKLSPMDAPEEVLVLVNVRPR